MRAELRGIVDGMRLAWDKGVRKLNIQTDSRAAVAILQNESETTHRHIFREANFAADYLANFGHNLDLGTHVFLYPDTALLYWLRYDLVGISTPRLINNNS
ncbi:Putative ribonuclease H protein At1g65750 [Linum perenne]